MIRFPVRFVVFVILSTVHTCSVNAQECNVNIGAVVAGTAGGIMAVILIVVLLYWGYTRYRRSNTKTVTNQNTFNVIENPVLREHKQENGETNHVVTPTPPETSNVETQTDLTPLLLEEKSDSSSESEESVDEKVESVDAETQTDAVETPVVKSVKDDEKSEAPLEALISLKEDAKPTGGAIKPLDHDSVFHDFPRTKPPLERTKSRDDITFKSGWRKTVKLLDLIRAKLILESRVLELEREEVTEEEVEKELHPYLVGHNPIAGITINETGQKMSLYHAYKQGIISRGTAVSLLEAQAATGSIIDPEMATKMSVADAKETGLIDRQFEAVLARAERAVTGYSIRHSNEKISLFQAMKQGKVVENHGIRLLEAQIATGGIIDPEANHRIPIEVAFERGLFDERLHQILEDPSDDTKGFLDPNTNENLSYLELIQRCVEDKENDLLYLPIVTDNQRQGYIQRHSSSTSRTFSSGRTRSSTGGSFIGTDDSLTLS